MYKPSIISFDVETNSLEYWSQDFKVISAGFVWRGEQGQLKEYFSTDWFEINDFIYRCIDEEIPLVCHNASFEVGVLQYNFRPIGDSAVKYDTMRLVQVFDNGGPDGILSGFSLDVANKRILGREDSHKQEAYDWIEQNLGHKTQKGKYIEFLPKDILERYNLADCYVTLDLYEYIIEHFRIIGYDWTLDHQLYMNMVRNVSSAQGVGIEIDSKALNQAAVALEEEIRGIDRVFTETLQNSILSVERDIKKYYVEAVKTDKAREAREAVQVSFNPKSTKQLEQLFVETMGIQPTFRTPKGKPSFKSSHLDTYGEGGKLLSKRNKRLLVLQQVKALIDLAEKDGRWHQGLKVASVKTGRLSGGNYD